eukprot:EG_transcript_24306
MHTLADRYPPLHAYSADRVVRITLFLQGLGVDVGRVLLKRPRILSLNVANAGKVVQVLRDRKVDLTKLINSAPEVLQRRPSSVRQKMDLLESFGHSAPKQIRRFPATLGVNFGTLQASMAYLARLGGKTRHHFIPLSVPKLKAKAVFLRRNGIDPGKAFQRAPDLTGISIEKMESVLICLHRSHLDVLKVVGDIPMILTLRLETIYSKLKFFHDNNLDFVAIVNKNPVVLLYNIERKLKPTLDFVLKEMQREPEEIVLYPRLWGVSL